MPKGPMHLTTAERRLFDALPEVLREGWQVQTEADPPKDTAEMRRMRLHLVQLHDPRLQKFVEEARSKDSVDSLAAHIAGVDLGDVRESDLAELFFALGAASVSALIASLLAEAKSDSDLQDIEALTIIRHELMTSRVTP